MWRHVQREHLQPFFDAKYDFHPPVIIHIFNFMLLKLMRETNRNVVFPSRFLS